MESQILYVYLIRPIGVFILLIMTVKQSYCEMMNSQTPTHVCIRNTYILCWYGFVFCFTIVH